LKEDGKSPSTQINKIENGEVEILELFFFRMRMKMAQRNE
jgi:hypothetical protein